MFEVNALKILTADLSVRFYKLTINVNFTYQFQVNNSCYYFVQYDENVFLNESCRRNISGSYVCNSYCCEGVLRQLNYQSLTVISKLYVTDG